MCETLHRFPSPETERNGTQVPGAVFYRPGGGLPFEVGFYCAYIEESIFFCFELRFERANVNSSGWFLLVII